MEMLFPRRLTPGIKIGIISTSSPAEPEWVERTREYFEERGYPVEVGQRTLDRLGFMAGSAEDRAQLVSQGLQETYESVILDNCTGYHFPVVSNLLIGHTLDQLTLPVGCLARLDTSRKALELVERPVR